MATDYRKLNGGNFYVSDEETVTTVTVNGPVKHTYEISEAGTAFAHSTSPIGPTGYVDEYGSPITAEQWAKKIEAPRWAMSDIVGGYRVSTIYMGQDPNCRFETMVFPMIDPENNDWREVFCERYDTLQGAAIGHLSMCKAILSGEAEFGHAG